MSTAYSKVHVYGFTIGWQGYIDREFIYMYILETFYCGIKNNAGAFVIGNVQWRSQPDF